MTIEKFIQLFAEQFDDTDASVFTPETCYRELDEWSSLVALSIISMVDEEMDKQLTGSELREAGTIQALFDLLQAK
ncbi:MAG TPA: acyl carrier protein [Candidatus Butyricimonas faecavium]|nr:acyl carrier protein [Candidatus Butyricimonas faecavium]